SQACDHAYADPLLFEAFDLWFNKEISDKALLFQVDHFFSTKNEKALEDERDLTNKPAAIEKIKTDADTEAARGFARQLKILAHKKGLTTNEKLGEFLGVSAERARVLLQGKHKPQFETLSTIAARFKVPLESFLAD
ncbi:MAG: helix-turn-helix transcriptional regulator, partial [Deltaproteobacteria bacterium]|nr:helix-turn-helix transcriptional regulator [Deltaproteobacteria bacterium]